MAAIAIITCITAITVITVITQAERKRLHGDHGVRGGEKNNLSLREARPEFCWPAEPVFGSAASF